MLGIERDSTKIQVKLRRLETSKFYLYFSSIIVTTYVGTDCFSLNFASIVNEPFSKLILYCGNVLNISLHIPILYTEYFHKNILAVVP